MLSGLLAGAVELAQRDQGAGSGLHPDVGAAVEEQAPSAQLTSNEKR